MYELRGPPQYHWLLVLPLFPAWFALIAFCSASVKATLWPPTADIRRGMA